MLTGIDSCEKTPSRMGFRRGLVQVRRGERDEPANDGSEAESPLLTTTR